MPDALTARDVMRAVYPRAPDAVIDAFASPDGQAWLAKAGISRTPQRMATAFAHCDAETSGFSIKNLTENINYTAERMAAVWPNRFRNAAAVRAKYGTAPGWQNKAFDDIYGNRMGNRPGTSDGSAYIGRGGPQVTGRDGYREVGARCGLPLEEQPELACRPEHQPAILAAFWMWKDLNALADKGGVDATVRTWNGGTNGLAERRASLTRILPIVSKWPASATGKSIAPAATPSVTTPVVPPAPPSSPAPSPTPQTLIGKLLAALAAILSKGRQS